jgi:hypothetical protein
MRDSVSSTVPAGVRATRWVVRSNRVTPSSASSLRIARDSEGGAISSRWAARAKFSSSATAAK